jgi:arabinan endo-1,5-alpha-L-arabinosidase
LLQKLFFILGLMIILVSCSTERGSNNIYQNPVFEPVLADPSVIKADDGFYYAYGTEDAWGDDPKTKLVPIIKSKDLINWEYVGEAFEKKPRWKGAGSLWAPDIAKINDKYYLFYSLSIWGDSDPGIGVAISDNPAGPFDDRGKLFTSEEIGVKNSIDPFYYEHEGIPYLLWGSFHGIYGIELSSDKLGVKGEKFQLAGDAYEAPYIIERDGFFYFFGSKGSCCEGENSTYHVAVARSDSFKGPYVDKEGTSLLDNGGNVILKADESGKFVGPGHNAIVTDSKGVDWIVYHAIDKEEPLLWTGASRRPLMIDPLIWKDGWPSVLASSPNGDSQAAPTVGE